MKHFLITGVSRGIGLKLTELSLKSGQRVFGLARHPEESSELSQLKKIYSDQLVLMSGDVTDPGLGEKILKAYPWNELDVLINNAGVYQDDTREGFAQSFAINSTAPYFLTQSLFPLLKKSKTPKVAFISSLMGSVGDNSSGGSVAYRASKSALNMIVKCLSLDESWLTSLLFHPGWVKTRMGGENAPTSPEDSAAGLLKLIEDSVKDDSGSYRDFHGKALRW